MNPVPRWVRCLARDGARWRAGGDRSARESGGEVTASSDARKRPLARVSATAVRQALAAGLVEDRGAGPQLTSAGLLAVGRPEVGEGRFAHTHRDLVPTAPISGAEQGAPPFLNRRESPMARWRDRLDPVQIEAGERFHADYVRSSLHSRVTQSWDAASLSGVRNPAAGSGDRTTGRSDATARLRRVYARLGPRLASVVDAAIIREDSQAALERRYRWPPRSGGAILGVVLDLIADVYGLSRQTPRHGCD